MRVRFAGAYRAWCEGDTARCLGLCARIRTADRDTARQVALLQARALLRLRRAKDALAVLRDAFGSEPGMGGALAVRMLAGTAYVRDGDAERGVALLEAAWRDADGASTVLRSEIALGLALGRYAQRDFAESERWLALVSADADVVTARGAELRGWIAKSRSDFPAAVAHFEKALNVLDGCRQLDRLLEANVIMVLGYLAVEMLDFERWAAVEQRSLAVRWDTSGLGFFHFYDRFWIEMNRSMMNEAAGRPREALQAARNATVYAPSDAFRIFAQCRRAGVLFAYGELLGYEDLAASIRHELEAIDLGALREFEEINLPFVVAETLALIGDEKGALAVRARAGAMSPAQTALLTDEPMKRAYLAFVEGVVADANSDAFTAQHRYRDAFRAFRSIGLTRRALLAALRLADLNGDADALSYADEQARRLPAGSWLRERSARSGSWLTDPLLAGLTRAEREVLALLYEGKSTADIAAGRGRSTQTIRNTVSKLLKTFSVDSRPALIRECFRRGVFPEAPADADAERGRRVRPLP
jgi:DNA-binding CsgD family transcriptional regulator/tetratricopeptide (TPR) repeat protein